MSCRIVSILKSLLDARGPTLELLSLRRSNWLEGHWLQLMCCAQMSMSLISTGRLMLEVLSVWRLEGWRFGGSEVLSSR